MEKITDILQEKAEGILTEDTLQAIENAFNNKVKLHVESALVKQDDEYSTKLEHLLEAIDIDHTKKLDKVIEAIDKNHGDKLISVVKKYSHAINEEATTFKKDLVNKVSKFLDSEGTVKIGFKDSNCVVQKDSETLIALSALEAETPKSNNTILLIFLLLFYNIVYWFVF